MSVLLATLLSISATTTPVVATPSFVQDETSQADRRYQSLEMLLNVPVTIDAEAKTRREAITEKKAPEKQTVSIQDFVVNETGALTWATVACEGLLESKDLVVLVPIERLNHGWKEGEPYYELRMTKAELKRSPVFDAEMAKKNGGLQGLVITAEASFRADSEKSEEQLKDAKGEAREATTPKHFLASKIGSFDVRGSDDAFGSVTSCVVDTRTNSVKALLVSHGGALGIGDTIRVIPFEAAKVGYHEKKLCLRMDKTAKELESAVEYEKPEKWFIEEITLARAQAFFGIQRTEK